MTAAAQPALSYSIKTDENGGKYVEIDTDQHLFDGLTTQEMQNAAKKVIVERFRNKTIGTDYTAYVSKKSAEHYAYPANRRMSEVQKQGKMRASTELDNIISASRFRENVEDDGRHPEATGGIDKLDVKLKVGGRMYDAEISVLVTDRGRRFYDLTKFKDITGREIGLTQDAAETTSNVSNVIISEAGEDVNAKFSLSSEENLTDAAGEDIITDEERGAILQYKSSESFKINQALRDGIALTPEMQRIVDCLDSALPKLPKVEGTLYRTLNFDDVTDAAGELNNFLATHKVGELIRCSAFTSASTTPDGYPLPEGVKCGVVMEIEGRSARLLEGFGNNFENEALYPRNTRFKVLSVEQSSDGIYRIKAKEVENNAEDLQGISGGDGTGRSPADLRGVSTDNDAGRPREIYQDGRPVERGEAVQQVQASEGINGDVQGISEVDTGRGVGGDRLPGVRAEGVDERFSLSGKKGRSDEVEYLRELNDYLREQMRMTAAAQPALSYSIKYDEANTPYVEIDEDILAGVPRAEWVRTVKDNMREKFPNGVTVGNNEIKINAQSRR